MAKIGPSRLRPLVFWFMPITRSPAQGSACKDLERDGQDWAITSEAAYTPIPNRAGSRLTKKTPPTFGSVFILRLADSDDRHRTGYCQVLCRLAFPHCPSYCHHAHLGLFDQHSSDPQT